MRRLLAMGHTIDGRDKRGWTPLDIACYRGFLDPVRVLLTSGASTNLQSGIRKQSPLHAAATRGHTGVVLELLHHRAAPDAVDASGRSPLYCAVWAGWSEPAKVLVDAGADVNQAAEDGRTPLHAAGMRGHAAAAEVLLQRDGINVNARDKFGRTPLLVAARYGRTDMVARLLECDPDTSLPENGGGTPLHLAAKHAPVEVVMMLFRAIDIDTPDAMAKTALHHACLRGRAEVAEALLDGGASTEAVDSGGCSPLFLASRHGHEECVEALLYRGADARSANGRGQTPLNAAKRYRHRGVQRILERHLGRSPPGGHGKGAHQK